MFLLSLAEDYYLVYWPEDNSVSVVPTLSPLYSLSSFSLPSIHCQDKRNHRLLVLIVRYTRSMVAEKATSAIYTLFSAWQAQATLTTGFVGEYQWSSWFWRFSIVTNSSLFCCIAFGSACLTYTVSFCFVYSYTSDVFVASLLYLCTVALFASSTLYLLFIFYLWSFCDHLCTILLQYEKHFSRLYIQYMCV